VLKPSGNIKWSITISIFLFCISFILFSSNLLAGSFTIKVKNPLDTHRNNEIIEIGLEHLSKNFPDFDFNSFSVSEMGKGVPFEVIPGRNSHENIILILLDFLPDETKEIVFTESNQGEKIEKRTQAYLGKKRDYELKDGFYTEGQFEEITNEMVPADHFAHDALYQFEGPGWESERVGYRLYLDDRNRTDIFGKKKPDLIIDKIGKNDLVSDGKESYQKMQDWGQDIFKVGNSLGIGSVGTYQDSVITISETDSVFCGIINNNLISCIKTIHYGWRTNNKNINRIETLYSIAAGSRLTKVDLKLDTDIDNLCTGLAKHENTEFFKSNNNEWGYIALWGKQTLANDNLGIAVFYNKSNLIELKEDQLSYLVLLGPEDNRLTYYFAAAWEQEQNEIKNKEKFISYLNDILNGLSHPIIVEIK
jgi:hypothetical protein